jgi:hypothetical protein
MFINDFTSYQKDEELYKFKLGVYQWVFLNNMLPTFDYGASFMWTQICTVSIFNSQLKDEKDIETNMEMESSVAKELSKVLKLHLT